MALNDLTSWTREKWRAAREWSAPRATRLGHAVKSAPWKSIGIWTGGIVGGLVVALVLLVTFADWNALKGPISRFASNASGREIVIAGDLDVDPWSFTPEFHVTELKIGNPRRFAERGMFADVSEAHAAVRLLPLLIGRLDIVRIDLDGADVSLFRNAEGDANWARDPRTAARGRQFNLPAIRRFSLNDGRLRYVDERRRMVLDATFTSNESANEGGRFVLQGEGQINNRPFSIEASGAPLLNVRRDRPYAFEADVRAAGTRIEAHGSITRPFDLNYFSADVVASGPDLADLYYLLGLALPNTPPYALRGRVERNNTVYGMPNVRGRIGDSDVAGNFTASRQRNGRLLFVGDFNTRTLDFDDLMAVLGGAPDTSETASTEQRAMAENLAASNRLLPDAQLDISRVRNMDARVSYRAQRVRTDRLPLRALAVDVNLDSGLLRLDPLTLSLNQGRVGGAVSINAREDVPRVDMDVRLRGARLESIIAMRGEPALTGALAGRVRLSGSGGSVRDAAANADGDVSFVVPQGEIREAFAELTGINVTRGLGLLLSDDQDKIAIRCGVASFQVTNGVANVHTFLMDTETMLIRGTGRVSLRNEQLDLRLNGEPKEARLLSVDAPIVLRGSLRSPRVGVDAEEALDEGGLAALLGTLVAPLAGVLPFIDPGLAEDADCRAALALRPQPVRAG
ncbi:hypothetical protein U91I_02170 [alpha proteobacterium U9-1i]|nr:hypothetical protein U91I_02170 [alpha proteobacterium U9-1i]